jgi:PAS domain-containing protein
MAMLDEASEALRFNRTLLQSTLESVPQGICAFDADFNITAWNGRFIALLDLPPDFVRVGLPLAELIVFNSSAANMPPPSSPRSWSIVTSPRRAGPICTSASGRTAPCSRSSTIASRRAATSRPTPM